MNMEKEQAQELMQSFLKLGSTMNDSASKIEYLKDETEKKQFRRAIAEMMSILYIDLMCPVIRNYPDLILIKLEGVLKLRFTNKKKACNRRFIITTCNI